jgi:hypothetical protein
MTDAAETTTPTPDREGLLVSVPPGVDPAIVERVSLAAARLSVAGETASPRGR